MVMCGGEGVSRLDSTAHTDTKRLGVSNKPVRLPEFAEYAATGWEQCPGPYDDAIRDEKSLG